MNSFIIIGIVFGLLVLGVMIYFLIDYINSTNKTETTDETAKKSDGSGNKTDGSGNKTDGSGNTTTTTAAATATPTPPTSTTTTRTTTPAATPATDPNLSFTTFMSGLSVSGISSV